MNLKEQQFFIFHTTTEISFAPRREDNFCLKADVNQFHGTFYIYLIECCYIHKLTKWEYVKKSVSFLIYAISVFESGEQLDAIYTDIRKAFDRLHQSILLRKLNDLGVYSSLLNWIKTYFYKRSQYVRISGWDSHIFIVQSGVPQGSHLGPLLFILFINDVVNSFKFSKCLLFADPLKLFKSIKSI